MRFLLVLVTAAILTAAGEQSMTVAQLVMFIRSSVQLKQPDRQVAEYLRKIKLTDKLDDRTIEDLQSLGAGAKTVAALRELGEASASLRVSPPPPPPPVYVPPPPPDSEEQAKIIDQTREYALNYTKQLAQFYLRAGDAARFRPHRQRQQLVSRRHHHGAPELQRG